MMGEDLLAIFQEGEEIRRYQETRRPTACPNDGTPLTEGPRGELRCRFDGWVWDGSGPTSGSITTE